MDITSIVMAVAAMSAGLAANAAGQLENVALGKKYEFLPNKPQYGHCTDEGDTVQLTDGKYVNGYFWTDKGCVGWMNYGANPKGVKIDLGADTPIRGFSWNFASGVAGVKFPQAIYAYVSLDGENWHFAGDLLGRATTLRVMPPPNEYHVYRAWCDDMYCHGRYVMFVAHQEACCFVDEVEVYRGPDKLLKSPMPGGVTKEPLIFGRTIRFRNRILGDAERVGLGKDKSVVARVNELDIEKLPADFQAILPLNDLHREILAANSKILRAAGFAKPVLWTNCRWDNLDPLAVPPRESVSEKPLVVEMMRNETRGMTFNILNPTKSPLGCKVEMKGFDDDTPFDCREVVFSDMQYFRCVSGALRPGDGSSVAFEIPAGVSKQVWLSVAKPKGAAGTRKGEALVALSNGMLLKKRVEVRVHDLDFPDVPRCHAGGWDYCHTGGGMCGCSPSNLVKRLALHREMFIDTVWRTGGPTGGKFDAAGNLVPGSLDFSNWDEWVTNICRDARIFCSFLATKDKFHGEPAGTPRFDKMATQWFRAWVEHARANGLNGRRMLVLTVDEPSNEKMANLSIKWMRCVKAAGCKELGVYADPIFSDRVIDKIDPEFWELCDVVCPHSISPKRAKMLREKGKEIWLYSAFGPVRIFDPVSYYRMQPWRAFVAGGCGTFYWMLGSSGKLGSFAAYAPRKTDYSPYFAMPTDVMHAKQSMAMLESIEDFEYLSMYAERFGREKAEALAGAGIKAHPNGDCDWDRAGMDRSVADTLCAKMLHELATKQ